MAANVTGMTTDFLALHRPGDPLLLPNAWDVGSARILADLGFAAVATTSSGFAATLGRLDGEVTGAEALAHAAALAAAVDVPVSADLEHGYGDAPEDVAATVAGAREAGLAGCSIEDHTGDADDPIYDAGEAFDRMVAAVEASHDLVLTARAENYLHGRPDLADTIMRLQGFQEAGADVLYAPGLTSLEEIRTVCAEVDRPVNVLLRPGGPSPSALAGVGVARISVGGSFAWVAYTGLVEAGQELLAGDTGFLERTGPGGAAVARALGR